MLRWHLGHTIPMIVRHPSAYPGLPRKSAARRLLENLWIYLRDGAPCAAYDGLGLDLRGRRLDDFVGNVAWIRFLLRHLTSAGLSGATPMQKLVRDACSPIHLLQDKYCFWSHLDRHGVPAVPVYAHTLGGELFREPGAPALESLDRFFVKPSDANCGTGAFIATVSGGRFFAGGRPLDLSACLDPAKPHVFQPVVENHEGIKAINPSTLNTLRIATCRTRSGALEPWDSGMLRVGRAASDVDNFAKGGVGIGIDPEGRLLECGFFHDAELRYTRVPRHPDSGVIFAGRPVPFYRESVELALRAHRLFPALATVAWDIAVTPSGPLLLEGNHDWDIEMLQVVHHRGAAAKVREIYG